VAVKLHRCPALFAKTKGHPCWKVQTALDEAGIDYEIVKDPALRWRGADYEKRTGTKLLPAIEFEDSTIVREESNELVARIKQSTSKRPPPQHRAEPNR
jgi:glutathione S-transferase